MRISSQDECASGDLENARPRRDNVRMALKPTGPGHFLRKWRESKGYTLEQVAERLDMSHQNLGKIERGKVPYQQGLLEALADIYGTDASSLIMRDPTKTDIWTLSAEVRQLAEPDLKDVLAYVEFVKQRAASRGG